MSPRDHDATGDRAILGHLQEIERDVRRMRQAVADATGTAESAGGLIEATVGVHGELVNLTLDPRLYRTPDADALADQIRTAVNEAGRNAQEKLRPDLTPYLPGDADGAADLGFEAFLRQFGQLRGGEVR
jgi:DNA-binding protein YbaB